MLFRSLPPAICAAATTAIEIIQNEPELRQRLWSNCDLVRRALAEHGIDVLANSVGPILPIVMLDAETVINAQRALEVRGCLVAAIRPPTVPNGTSRLRISLTAAHDESALNCLIEALQEVVPVS